MNEGNLTKLIDDWVSKLNSEKSLPMLTEKDLDGIYSIGYTFYSENKYEDAIQFFHFLTMYDPLKQSYLMALGAAYQMNKNPEAALKAYSKAYLLDNTNPKVHLHASECLFCLKRNEEAIEALDDAERTAKAKNNKAILNQVKAMRKKLISGV